jgi:hypothetical protein
MRKYGDKVREILHDGCPVAGLGDALFGYVNVFTSLVNGSEADFHLFRIQACVLPSDDDNRHIEVRKDVGGSARNHDRAQQQNQHLQHNV